MYSQIYIKEKILTVSIMTSFFLSYQQGSWEFVLPQRHERKLSGMIEQWKGRELRGKRIICLRDEQSFSNEDFKTFSSCANNIDCVWLISGLSNEVLHYITNQETSVKWLTTGWTVVIRFPTEFCIQHLIRTGSEDHRISYPMSVGGFLRRGKADEA